MSNPDGLRVPPHSEEAERGVIGSILLDPPSSLGKAQGKHLRAEMFYDRRHQALFNSLLDMLGSGKAMDAITIGEWLKARNELELVGGYNYLVQLQDSTLVPAHIEFYSDIVVEKYKLRRIINLGSQMVDDAYKGEDDADNLIESIPSKLVKISGMQTRDVTNQEVLDAWYQKMVDIKEGRRSNGLPLPWDGLNTMMCGLEPGLIVIGALRSTGKTTLELNICDYLAAQGVPVARACLDMSREQLLCRSVICAARVSMPRIKRGYARWNQLETVRECKDLVAKWPFHVIESNTVEEICREARMLKLKHDIQLLTVDFAQLVGSLENPKLEGQLVILMGVVTKALKALAFELEIPVILLSQLNRASGKAGEKARRPVLSDLRDSGKIEENATQVLLLSKALEDDLPMELPEDADRGFYRPVIFDLAKNQNGETGEIHMVLRPNYFRFDESEPEYVDMKYKLAEFRRETEKEIAESDIPGARETDTDVEVEEEAVN